MVKIISKIDSVIIKDSLITTDSLSPPSIFQACRYSNGRDWWLITFSHNHDYAYVFLLDPTGCRLIHKIQTPMNYFLVPDIRRVFRQGDK